MKRFMCNGLAVLLMAGFICFPALAAQGNVSAAPGDQDFILVNKTGVEIYALFVTPHSAEEWGEDILGADTLPPDENIVITFARKEKATYWDLRVEDEDGQFIEWEKLNLRKISSVTLYYKDGKATAVVN